MSEVTLDRTATSPRQRGLVVLWFAYLSALCWGLAVGVVFGELPTPVVAALSGAAALVGVFVFSLRCDNGSIVVPYWGLAPVAFSVYWMLEGQPGPVPVRPFAAILLLSVWSARLTGQFLTRWGGLEDEDPRGAGSFGRSAWARVLGRAAAHVATAASVFLGTLPLHPALSSPGEPLGALDLLASAVTSGGILVEWIADLQVRRFQRAHPTPRSVLPGGLWAVSRHPDYLGEILFWWGLYLFGLAAEPGWAWTVVGPLAITARFVLLTVPASDRWMSARYPGWAERMRAVPALFPWRRTAVAPSHADR